MASSYLERTVSTAASIAPATTRHARLPVGPHLGGALTPQQAAKNQAADHGAWKMAFDDNLHSLSHGLYEGWDLHPAQFIPRYAAV